MVKYSLWIITTTQNSLPLVAFIIILSSYLHLANSIHFQINRFDQNDARVLYQGDAVASVGAVEFNNVDYLCRVGRVISAERVRLWDADTGKLSDFTTRFSFTIDTLNRAYYAAGLAFFLAPVGFEIPTNSAGGFLGLFNTTTSDSSRNQIVLVEFDSFSNPEWDPPVQHVGINNNSISSAVFTPWNASFHSGDTADVLINYNATTLNLNVSWSYRKTYNAKEKTSLSYQINLMKILPEWITVGFSASTSHYVERHLLQSWEFSSTLEVKETEKQNPEVMRKDADHKKTPKKDVIILVVALTIFVGFTILGMVVSFMLYQKLNKQNKKAAEVVSLTSINDDLERGAGVPRRFSYADLVSATENFANNRKLGEGGFGAVYKGYLKDLDTTVAVKRISKGSKQGKKEYITEVKVISSLRHRNLVQLIGWCHDGEELLLVYEFMPNGSLDFHLFGKRISPLTWPVRYKISMGLASALFYLHDEWEQCVVHRDIKSSNVMLDSKFNVKLGDFGLARLMDHELGPQTTALVGTLGYLAPEYISTGRASKESDVYSFGVVALEIATGRRSIDPMKNGYQIGLVQWVWDLYGKGKVLSAVDERLSLDIDREQVECLMIVGLWCAHPDPSLRPNIRQAIQVMKLEASLPNIPPKMPLPMYHSPTMHSVNSGDSLITTSLQVGR